MNIAKAHFNMVQQQIRPWDVLDNNVLDAIKNVSREKFVPSNYQDLAFIDTEIPLGHAQVMLSPKIIARILQALQLTSNKSVLEIGTGSGYLTALLATLCHNKITSVEINQELLATAERNLNFLTHADLNLVCGDGLSESSLYLTNTFDAIILTGSVPLLPDNIKNLLNTNGKLFAVIGSAPIMQACLITNNPDNTNGNNHTHDHQILFETFIPPLINAPDAPKDDFF